MYPDSELPRNAILRPELKMDASAYIDIPKHKRSVLIAPKCSAEVECRERFTPQAHSRKEYMTLLYTIVILAKKWRWESPEELTNYTDHNIQAFILSSLVLEAPHPIRLVVPVGASRAMHTSPTNMRFAISSCGFLFHITC